MEEELLTPQEFAQSIKAKYPEYADVDDLELADAMILKYPEYAKTVNFEKKNPIQSEDVPSGDLPSEDIKLDSTDPSKEDGSLESEDVDNSVGEDMWKGLKAGTKEALAGISGIPNFINKGLFSLIAPDEVEDYVNTLTPDQREIFINNMVGANQGGTTTGAMAALGEHGGDAQEKLNKEAEELRTKMTQYDASITEDLGKGDFSQAGRRIAVEGVGTIPSIVQAMIPYVGLASIGAGAASQKQERLEDEGKDFGGKTIVNSALTGAAEAALEKFTLKQGKGLLKALAGKGEKVIRKGIKGLVDGLREVTKGALGEGGTEALQSISENLIDALTTGNDKEAFEIFTEITDSFLVGFAVGAPMKGGAVVLNSTTGKATTEPTKKPTKAVENADVELNIPAVETKEELQTQLDFITKKDNLDPETKATLVRELTDKINAIEKGTDNQGVTIAENGVNENNTDNSPDTANIEESVVENINEKRTNGISDAQIIKDIEDPDEKRTAEIIMQREKDQSISPEDALKKSKESAQKSRDQQTKGTTSHLTDVEQAVNNATDMLVDRQGSVKSILKESGLETTSDFMVAKLGASAYAKHQTQEAHAKTFEGLKTKDVKSLEEIIWLQNIISIDSERKRLGKTPVKHQDGFTTVSAQKALDGRKAEMGTTAYNKFLKKSKNYFDTNKELLTTMKKEGLISQASYDAIITRDYQSRVYLDFLEDMEGNFLTEELDGFEASTLSSKSPIKSMKGGSEGSQSMDSQTLQQRSILARTKAVSANRLNNAFAKELKPALVKLAELEAVEKPTKTQAKQLRNLKELNANVKMDKIIGFNEKTGKPKYALSEATTKGFKAVWYYKDGIANRIFIKESFHQKFTDTSNQIMNANSRETISKISGTRLVKTLATGQNPLFFITNIPRDLAFALAFSKEYGNGAKTIVPIEMVKLIRDFAKGIGSSVAKGSSYQKYIEYGGGMDFLTIQGRYGKEGIFNRWVENKVGDKLTDLKQTKGARGAKWLMDGIHRFNTASEFATRLAVFERSIANQLKKKGVKSIDALTDEKQTEVYTKAVRSARELTDFNQGGKATKALDAGMPYLNAATQGTRSAVENFKNDPWGTTSRILQITAGFSTLLMTFSFNMIGIGKDMEDEEIANMTDQEIYFETLKAVSPYDLRNYYIIPKGVKDAKGNWEYIRIAKAQALSPFINASEHFLRKFYSEAHGIEYKQDFGKELWETVNLNILPIGTDMKSTIGRVPLVDAYVASLGIDAYTGNPLDWKRGKIPPQLEGINSDRVEDFYKELGEVTDYSPIRMKAVIESFITTPSTNPYIGFSYMGADAIVGSEKKDMLESFKKTSMKRVLKSTSQYNQISKQLERVSGATVDAYRRHMVMEKEVRDVVRQVKQDLNADPLEDILNKIYKDTPDMAEKAIKWAKSELEKEKVNPFVNSLKFERNKEVRAIILAEKFGNALLKNEDAYTDKEKAIVKELFDQKVIDAEVYNYYRKIVEED